MARKSSKAIRERNKPQRQLNRELKAKQSTKRPKDFRDIFVARITKQLEALKDGEVNAKENEGVKPNQPD